MELQLLNEMFLTEAFEPNHQSLIDLVANKRIISFYYKGDKETGPGWRTVEPVCYGERKGVRYLRAWQQAGKTTTINNAWKFFRIDRIKNWNLSSNKINDKARDKFNPKGDKLLDKIYAISDYTPKVAVEPTPDVVAKTPVDDLPDLSKVKDKAGFFRKVLDKIKSLVPDKEKRRKMSIALRDKLFENNEPKKRLKTLEELFLID